MYNVIMYMYIIPVVCISIHCTCFRVISSKMSRVCLDFSLDGSKVLSTSLSTDSHSELSAMIGIQGLCMNNT